ncbi:glycosyl hydrolase [Trametes punicea]|nr:glycosyl hydrolase [Trametes punicea]
MNDPNGLFLDGNETYHLYYQCRPVNQPISIFPTNNNSRVFSGSAVIDVNNTSGFFPDQKNGVIAVYTLNAPMAQVQEIAYSHDEGCTFTHLVDGSEEGMYVLTISVNLCAPLGGSCASYPLSAADSPSTPFDGAARIADFAEDNYAGQLFYDTPAGEDAISIAWASDWQYAQNVPTAEEGWRSAMSLPRRNFLANLTRTGCDLVSLPYDLSSVLRERLAVRSDLGNGTLVIDYSHVQSNALYFQSRLGRVAPRGVLFGGDNPFFLDRGRTRGFDVPLFMDKFSTASLLRADGTWTLSGVIDRSIIDVLVDRGAYSATATFLASQQLTLMRLTTAELPADVSVSVAVYALKSAWQDYGNAQAVVVGKQALIERPLELNGKACHCP